MNVKHWCSVPFFPFSLEMPSQTFPELCFLDSKSCPADSQDNYQKFTSLQPGPKTHQVYTITFSSGSHRIIFISQYTIYSLQLHCPKVKILFWDSRYSIYCVPSYNKKLHMFPIQQLVVNIPSPERRQEMNILKWNRSQAIKASGLVAPCLTSGAHDGIIWTPKGLCKVISSLQLDA